jgi:hypothetical protein
VRALLGLAWPIVLARATQSVIGFTDALFVAPLGEAELAATTTGAMNTFAVILLPMGTVFIVQSFVAQLAGRGERAQTPRFASYGLIIALASGLVALAAIPALAPLLELTDFSREVKDAMASHMDIRMLSVTAVVATEAIGNWYGGLGNTWMQMIAGMITMTSAVFCNWLFIDGHLGAPALGVDGAAVGSVIASWLGFSFLAIAPRGWAARRAAAALGLSRRELVRVVRFAAERRPLVRRVRRVPAVRQRVSRARHGAVAALNVARVNSIASAPAFRPRRRILAGLRVGRGDRDGVAAGQADARVHRDLDGDDQPDLHRVPRPRAVGVRAGSRRRTTRRDRQRHADVQRAVADLRRRRHHLTTRAAGDNHVDRDRAPRAGVECHAGGVVSVRYANGGPNGAMMPVAYLALHRARRVAVPLRRVAADRASTGARLSLPELSVHAMRAAVYTSSDDERLIFDTALTTLSRCDRTRWTGHRVIQRS